MAKKIFLRSDGYKTIKVISISLLSSLEDFLQVYFLNIYEAIKLEILKLDSLKSVFQCFFLYEDYILRPIMIIYSILNT